MNNFDAFRAVTRRFFWDNYISCLTCVALPIESGSSFASGDTMDIGVDPIFQAAGPASLSAVAAGGSVTLTWSEVPGAYAYVLYRSTTAAGPFTITAAGVIGEVFVDESPGTGTFHYRVTGIEPAFGETLPSPVDSVTV